MPSTTTKAIMIDGQTYTVTTAITITAVPASATAQLDDTTTPSCAVRLAEILANDADYESILRGLQVSETLSKVWVYINDLPASTCLALHPSKLGPMLQVKELLRQDAVLDCLKGCPFQDQIDFSKLLEVVLKVGGPSAADTWMGQDMILRDSERIQISRALWHIMVGPKGLADHLDAGVISVDNYLFEVEAFHLWNAGTPEKAALGWFARLLEFWGWKLRRLHGL